MLKYVENDAACHALLQDALKTILGVLKYVNDIMHQVSIVNYDVSKHQMFLFLFLISTRYC